MPVTIITATPAYITPEEHRERTASTPASFADIPPVLRRKEENAHAVFDPPIPDLSEEELKDGTVYVLESVLAFISSTSGRGFQIDYPSIILHAVSRNDPPSLYCQLGEPASEVQDGIEDEEEATELRELNIYPENAASVKDLFEALSHCASLHPDATSSDDSMDEEDEDEDAVIDENVQAAQGLNDEPELSEAGRATLDRFESLLQDKPSGSASAPTKINGIHTNAGGSEKEDQFADAPEEPRS